MRIRFGNNGLPLIAVGKPKSMTHRFLDGSRSNLRKALPDLSSVEMKHEGVTPFAVIPDMVQDVRVWEDLG